MPNLDRECQDASPSDVQPAACSPRSGVPLHTLLILLGVVFVGQGTVAGDGFFSFRAVGWTLLAWLFVLTAAVTPDRLLCLPEWTGRLFYRGASVVLAVFAAGNAWQFTTPTSVFTAAAAPLLVCLGWRLRLSPLVGLVGGVALLLTAEGALTSKLLYLKREGMDVLKAWSAVAGWLTTAAIVPLAAGPGKKTTLRVLVLCLFGCGTLVRCATVLASPDPFIDVATVIRGAADHLLRGENPYGAEYFDPYRRAPALEEAGYPTYPPLPFLTALPCVSLGIDFRWANVVADLLAALALYRCGVRRSRPGLAALLTAMYLFHPYVPIILENAWYEPQLAALVGWGLLLVDARCKGSGLLLGLALTGKQYGAVAAVGLLRTVRRPVALLGAVAVAAALTLLPFFLWNPRAFLRVVVTAQFELPPRLDGVTVPSLVAHVWGAWPPRTLMLTVCAAVVGLISWRSSPKTANPALAAGAVLLTFFLCHAQAFVNYFYLCQYLLLFGAQSRLVLSEPEA
jgi:hypothetical protein